MFEALFPSFPELISLKCFFKSLAHKAILETPFEAAGTFHSLIVTSNFMINECIKFEDQSFKTSVFFQGSTGIHQKT